MSENKDNKLTLINEKTANDYLTHTIHNITLIFLILLRIIKMGDEFEFDFEYHLARERTH